MPADNDLDPVDRWLNQQVWPMAPPDGTFEQITKRARRRRVRNAAISVASAAAVAVAVAIAVPLGLIGGLGSSGPGRVVIAASGSSRTPSSSQSEMGTGTHVPSPSSTAASALPTATGSAGTTIGPSCITTPGCLPDKFIPATVTWVGPTTGFVMGQAGTPGTCGAEQNSDICTSIAITHDSGQTWAGVNAPLTGAASGLTGVSQLRFLNGVDGWAYGPELWATHDGGLKWTKIRDPFGDNRQVTDLETINDRAYALWANCTKSSECFSYTLMSTSAGQDDWAPVSGVPQNLAAASTGGAQIPGSASFEIGGSYGYLIAPDGSLYVGSLPQGGSPSTWQRASATLPCNPSWLLEGAYGQSQQVLLAPYWAKGGTPSLAVVCEVNAPSRGFSTTVWISRDNGATWTEQKNVGNAGVSLIGKALSLTATSTGGLIIATKTGIYRLPPGASQWQQVTFSGAATPPSGFSYVGMTNDSQGVAIADPGDVGSQPNPDPYGIWMTLDGGQTWQFHKIKGKSS
ncbi:MAG TPA: hypothetical protein VMI73_07675 [Trebonia sp.]|nr:hypothetical protein [Trebonia sp.]